MFRIKDRFVGLLKDRWLVKCSALCVIAGLLGVSYLKFKTVPYFGDYVLKIILGLSIIMFILAVNVRVNIGNKISHFLGSISYEIYLLHGITFGIVDYMMDGIASGVFILISFIITVVLSFIAYWMSNKILEIFK